LDGQAVIAVDIKNASHVASGNSLIVTMRMPTDDGSENPAFSVLPADFCEKQSATSDADNKASLVEPLNAGEVRKFALFTAKNPRNVEVEVYTDEFHKIFGLEMAPCKYNIPMVDACYEPY
jgi:hypothetical protein